MLRNGERLRIGHTLVRDHLHVDAFAGHLYLFVLSGIDLSTATRRKRYSRASK